MTAMDFDEILDRYNRSHPLARIERRPSASCDLLLALSGDMEMKMSSDMAPILVAALLECPSRGRFTLDLSRVGYISSTGVGLLATLMVSAEKRLITLSLLDMPSRVRNIMDTLGLLDFFKLEASDG